jgi:two-component system, NarL family, sensor histidine kinase UhpB
LLRPTFIHGNIGKVFKDLGQKDSARIYLENALLLYPKFELTRKYQSTILYLLADLYSEDHQYEKAHTLLNHALALATQYHNFTDIGNIRYLLTNYFTSLSRIDSSLYYGKQSVTDFRKTYDDRNEILALKLIAKNYQKLSNKDSQLRYLQLASALESQYRGKTIKNLMDYQNLGFEEQLRMEEMVKKQELSVIERRNSVLKIGIGAFLLFTALLLTLYYQKQKAKENIERAYGQLKSAQLQLREMEKKNTALKIRQSISSDLHDEVGSTLTSIELLSNMALNHDADTAQTKSTIEKIKTQTKTVQARIRDIVWASQSEHIISAEFEIKCKEVIAKLFEPTSIDYKVKFKSMADSGINLSSEQAKNLLMIIRESIQNIIKHAYANQVFIDWSISSSGIDLTISDNGVGIQNEQKSGSGIKIIQSRVKSMGGNLTISKDGGTTLYIKIPL